MCGPVARLFGCLVVDGGGFESVLVSLRVLDGCTSKKGTCIRAGESEFLHMHTHTTTTAARWWWFDAPAPKRPGQSQPTMPARTTGRRMVVVYTSARTRTVNYNSGPPPCRRYLSAGLFLVSSGAPPTVSDASRRATKAPSRGASLRASSQAQQAKPPSESAAMLTSTPIDQRQAPALHGAAALSGAPAGSQATTNPRPSRRLRRIIITSSHS